jgi:hypothetical protein
MVNIAAPPGEPLTLGSYTGAVRAAFRGPGEPGLDVFGDGRGCNTVSGQFDVTELSYAPTGELLVFDATFEQHCEGGPAALFGRIRIESTPPPPDVTPPTLNLPSEVNVEAPDASGTYVSYAHMPPTTAIRARPSLARPPRVRCSRSGPPWSTARRRIPRETS